MSQNQTAAQFDDTFDGAIRWESEAVATVYGDNQSDKRTVNAAAQIAVMQDVQKFEVAFPGYILQSSDGTSLRVACQRIGRKFNGKDVEGNRKAVIAHLQGVRASRTQIVRRALPDGTFYTGTDEVEFRQTYAAALVDAGVDSSIALGISKALPW